MKQVNITEFYDEFVDHQSQIGVSTRHRIIHQNLKAIGLTGDSNVLEVGCGIGTVSSLIIKSIPKGQFLGVDISPESIATAKKINPQSNAQFIVNDMSDFASDMKFDFIVFPDVLEHIPIEQHYKLFENIAKVSKSNTKVLINIPEPNSINWVRKNKPQDLQIIDQALSMQDLLNNTYPHGFEVQSICPYSIHTKHYNYVKIVLVRNGEIENFKKIGKIGKTMQNLKARFF